MRRFRQARSSRILNTEVCAISGGEQMVEYNIGRIYYTRSMQISEGDLSRSAERGSLIFRDSFSSRYLPSPLRIKSNGTVVHINISLSRSPHMPTKAFQVRFHRDLMRSL